MLYVDLPTRAEIEALIRHRAQPTVSIYLPTTPVTRDTQADRIALKNHIRTATDQLHAAGTDKRKIWPIEESLSAIVDDDEFWGTQAHSLAIFASTDKLLTFRLPNRLSTSVQVSDRAHVKPLLRAVTFPQTAFILAISIGSARVIEVSPDLPPHEIRIPDLPKRLTDALNLRRHIERKGDMASGEGTSESALLTRYAKTVDDALRPFLTGHERPLVVAAAEPLASYARAVSSYPHTAAQVIPGTADRTPDHELAAAVRGVLDGIYAAQLQEIAALYDLRANQGRASADIAQTARAATFGAVDTLVFDMDEVIPGTVSDDDGSVTFADADSANSYGIVDEIVSRTFLAGGRVIAARRDDIPGGGPLAAILRYPI